MSDRKFSDYMKKKPEKPCGEDFLEGRVWVETMSLVESLRERQTPLPVIGRGLIRAALGSAYLEDCAKDWSENAKYAVTRGFHHRTWLEKMVRGEQPFGTPPDLTWPQFDIAELLSKQRQDRQEQ